MAPAKGDDGAWEFAAIVTNVIRIPGKAAICGAAALTGTVALLLTYGTHAKAVIPELTKLGYYFEKDEKDFPKKLMLVKAKSVRDTIAAIEASTDTPELISIK